MQAAEMTDGGIKDAKFPVFSLIIREYYGG